MKLVSGVLHPRRTAAQMYQYTDIHTYKHIYITLTCGSALTIGPNGKALRPSLIEGSPSK